ELIAGFEPLQVPARQLADLQIGDVIRTRQSVSRPLVARVGGERLFHIRAAQRGQRLVAELTGHADGANRDVTDQLRLQAQRQLGGGRR
ncbi:MAG: FliM/FliN family flagellar motor C-terminal domain-containing protein, partial [Actinomycetota bacterium]